jgi:hypothetical protein
MLNYGLVIFLFDTVKIQATKENKIIITLEINPSFNITVKELYFKYHFLIVNKNYSTTTVGTYNYCRPQTVYICSTFWMMKLYKFLFIVSCLDKDKIYVFTLYA